MIEDPRLRERVAQVRDRARSMRAEYKRHSKEPNWDLVRDLVADPLTELADEIGDELARKQSPDKLVPIDRDPVPAEFTELVREYYEKLGSGE